MPVTDWWWAFLRCFWFGCRVPFRSHVAADKGHNGAAWFFGGILFGPIVLIAAAGLSDQTLRRYIRPQQRTKVLTTEKPSLQVMLRWTKPGMKKRSLGSQ